jgi:uncharacterized protein YidB (DUF937 family)
MSLFDRLSSQMGGGGDSTLLGGVLDMLGQSGGGGLGGLVQAFEAKGLGKIVASWISTGENLPVSPDQIRAALGTAGIQQLAEKVGMAPDTVNAKLAELLPVVIDKLTPSGELPKGGMLEQGLSFLRSALS